MSIYKRVERLEQEMNLVNPTGETVYFQVGKGYYDPNPEELAEMREYDLAHPNEDKSSLRVSYRIMPFKRDGLISV